MTQKLKKRVLTLTALLTITLFATISISKAQNTCSYFTKIAAGTSHTLGIKNDGSLWAWGKNLLGQLGDGTYTDKNKPIQIGTAKNWLTVSAGDSHSLGITTDGKLWAWGWNGSGQLGDGSGTVKNMPIQIGTSSTWVSISAGDYHSLGITKDGKLWAWGSNGYGQLGDGTIATKKQPIQIGTDSNWLTVSGGYAHSLGITTDGKLWAWGDNIFGEVGDSTNINRYQPVQIGKTSKWVSISSGDYHSHGITTDGRLWGWGLNEAGVLGDGTKRGKNIPVQTGTATNWKSISAGHIHSLGITADGKLWAWGDNSFGQLGDGTNTTKIKPVQIGTASNWKSISAGRGYFDGYSLGITTDNKLWAWGGNANGQQGNGTNTSTNEPTYISTSTISSQPNSKTIYAGDDATFSVAASGASLTYGWQVSSNGGNSFSNLNNGGVYSGVADDTLQINNATQSMDSYQYRCIILGNCSDTSASAVLNVSLCTNPSIASATADVDALCVNTTTTLHANGVAGTNAIVNWWTGSGGTGTNLGTGLTLLNVKAGTYYARVTGNCGTPAEAFVTVSKDTIRPTVVCPSNVTINNAVGCSKNVLIPAPAYTDNCSIKSVQWQITGASTYSSANTGINVAGIKDLHNGINKISYRVVDSSNNIATCYFNLLVADIVKPVFTSTIKTPLNGTNLTQCTGMVKFPTIAFSDNCGTPALQWMMSGANNVSGTGKLDSMLMKTGTTQIIYSLKDNAGNTTTAYQVVNVTERVSPTIDCPSGIVKNIAGCCTPVVNPAPVYADNCSIQSLVWNMTGATTLSSPASGINLVGTQYFNAGTTFINYVVRDSSNNPKVCTYKVLVKTSTSKAAKGTVENEQEVKGLSATLVPNPTTTGFGLMIQSDKSENTAVLIYSSNGQKIEQRQILPNRITYLGETYKKGSYLFEVRQGEKRTTVVGVKQ